MKAWYAKVSPDRHRLFVGRHYDDVAIDQGVLIVTTRRGGVVYTAPIDALRVERVRARLLLQVLARDPDNNTHVFEFRPRRHAEGRALHRALAAAPAAHADALG
ncbi:MAG TPA: hypothetical protein VGN51_06025 [Acidimicrobiia bacterium]|jgi:hypothetical protein